MCRSRKEHSSEVKKTLNILTDVYACSWKLENENFSRCVYADLSPVGVPVNQRPKLCIPVWNIILGFKMHRNYCFCSPVIISGEGDATNSILKCTS